MTPCYDWNIRVGTGPGDAGATWLHGDCILSRPLFAPGFRAVPQAMFSSRCPMTISESIPDPTNPLGMDGIEFIEYTTSQPQAFGALLQNMGFAAVARHRS